MPVILCFGNKFGDPKNSTECTCEVLLILLGSLNKSIDHTLVRKIADMAKPINHRLATLIKIQIRRGKSLLELWVTTFLPD